jgi:hypothetical protein
MLDDAFVKVSFIEDTNQNMFMLRPFFNWADDWGKMLAEMVSVIVMEHMRVFPDDDPEKYRNDVISSLEFRLASSSATRIGSEKPEAQA